MLCSIRPAPQTSTTVSANLDGDEGPTESLARRARAGGAVVAAQSRLRTAGRCAEGGHEAEGDRGEHRDAGSERQRGSVNGDVGSARHPAPFERPERHDAEPRDACPRRSSQERERKALDSRQPDKPPALGTKRAPDGHLAKPPFAPGQQEVRHVGAHDEQNESRGREQQHQNSRHRSDDVLEHRPSGTGSARCGRPGTPASTATSASPSRRPRHRAWRRLPDGRSPSTSGSAWTRDWPGRLSADARVPSRSPERRGRVAPRPRQRDRLP